MADAMLKIVNNNGTIRIFSDKDTGQNAPSHRGRDVQPKSEPDGRPGLVEEGEAGHGHQDPGRRQQGSRFGPNPRPFVSSGSS